MCELTKRSGIETLKEKRTGWVSHENLKSSFRVFNKFGSLVPLILLLRWGCCYCLLSFFFSLGGCYSSPLASVLFLGEISPTGDPKKKKSSATSIKDFIFENFQNIRHIS